MEESQQNGRGGYRANAGRKKVYVDGKRYGFNADSQVVQILEQVPDKTAFIRQCILEHQEREEECMPDLSQLGTVYPLEGSECMVPFGDVAVACGTPLGSFRDDSLVQTDLMPLLCQNTDMSYMVVAKGNSMIDANIQSGDLVIVDLSQREPLSRKPMLCELNGGYTVKYVRHLSDGYWLQPANPTFADIPVEEGDEFRIWGVVTSVVHRF